MLEAHATARVTFKQPVLLAKRLNMKQYRLGDPVYLLNEAMVKGQSKKVREP